MKVVFSGLLLASFISIAVFGFLAMHNSGNMQEGCLAAAAQRNGVCPLGFGSLAEALFHASAYKSFSIAVLGSLVFMIAALSLANGLFGLSKLPLVLFFISRLYSLADKFFSSKKEFLHWLAMHENSPAFA